MHVACMFFTMLEQKPGFRHMELYFAVSGMGAILHTVNISHITLIFSLLLFFSLMFCTRVLTASSVDFFPFICVCY